MPLSIELLAIAAILLFYTAYKIGVNNKWSQKANKGGKTAKNAKKSGIARKTASRTWPKIDLKRLWVLEQA